MTARLVRSAAWVVVLLAGCSDHADPPSDPCAGIDGDYEGGLTLFPADTKPLLVGDTRKFELIRYFDGGPETVAFDLPATITDVNATVSIERTGSSLLVQGIHDGSADISFVADACPDLLRGSFQFDVPMIDHMIFLPGDMYVPSEPVEVIPPGLDVAFAREASVDIGIGLVRSTNSEYVLIDHYTELVPPTGARVIASGGFDISGVAEGSYTVQVTAGGSTFTAPFVVVDHADTIASMTADLGIPSSGLSACFEALTANRYLENLTWTFTLDGSPTPIEPFFHNCVNVLPQNDLDHDGMVQISASAGGASAQFAARVL